MRQTIGQVSINSSLDSSSWARFTPPANETNIFKTSKWSSYVTSTASLPKPVIKTQFLSLPFWDSMNEISWSDHFSVTYSTLLVHCTINFLEIAWTKFGDVTISKKPLRHFTCALHQFFDSNLQTAFLHFFFPEMLPFILALFYPISRGFLQTWAAKLQKSVREKCLYW